MPRLRSKFAGRTLLVAVPSVIMTLGGCAAGLDAHRGEDAAPTFAVEQFFQGRTRGRGQVRVLLGPARQVDVEGMGTLEADGTLVLKQRVLRAGKPPQLRTWRITKISIGHYVGTLTDAAGPVTLDVYGSRLNIRYRLKSNGARAEQWIDLQPGGRSALNRMTFRKFGVKVAGLTEIIQRID